MTGCAAAGRAVVNGQDVATLTLDALTTGNHTVTAAYGGDASFAPSALTAVNVTINWPALAPTTTTLTSSPATALLAQPVTFTAIVSPQDASIDPTGLAGKSVQFTIDKGTAAVVLLQVVNGREVATLTTSTLAAGNHIVSASFCRRFGLRVERLKRREGNDHHAQYESDAGTVRDGDNPGPSAGHWTGRPLRRTARS